MKLSIRGMLLLILIAALFTSCLAEIQKLNKQVMEAKRHNTIGWVAKMVISHLKDNGEWPRNWDELKDDYKTVVCEFGQPWQLEDLQKNVEIDWTTDLEKIQIHLKQSEIEFRVLRMSNGSQYPDIEKEANELIFDYVRGRERHSIGTGY